MYTSVPSNSKSLNIDDDIWDMLPEGLKVDNYFENLYHIESIEYICER